MLCTTPLILNTTTTLMLYTTSLMLKATCFMLNNTTTLVLYTTTPVVYTTPFMLNETTTLVLKATPLMLNATTLILCTTTLMLHIPCRNNLVMMVSTLETCRVRANLRNQKKTTAMTTAGWTERKTDYKHLRVKLQEWIISGTYST
jgi:hypothetical protein